MKYTLKMWTIALKSILLILIKNKYLTIYLIGVFYVGIYRIFALSMKNMFLTGVAQKQETWWLFFESFYFSIMGIIK